jgi:hypothetical protein
MITVAATPLLSETQFLKPIGDLLHRGSAPDHRASSSRIGKITRQSCRTVGSKSLASSRTHRRAGGLRDTFADRCQPPWHG